LYKGKAALEKSEFPQAVALLSHYISNLLIETPRSIYMVYLLRSKAFGGMGKLNEAHEDAVQVVTLEPDFVEVCFVFFITVGQFLTPF
jgi:hypothetical protein